MKVHILRQTAMFPIFWLDQFVYSNPKRKPSVRRSHSLFREGKQTTAYRPANGTTSNENAKDGVKRLTKDTLREIGTYARYNADSAHED